MRLTRFTDFGLRTLTRRVADFAGTFTVEEIVIAFATSLSDPAGVVRDLAGANFVIARRGACGGLVRESQNKEIASPPLKGLATGAAA